MFYESKLYVGNLPYEVGETELQELFARAGSVESVMRDHPRGLRASLRSRAICARKREKKAD